MHVSPHQNSTVKFVRLPYLKHIELRFSDYRREAFKKHTHDTYSIGVVTRGRTDFFHHGQVESIGAGGIALIEPEEVHACNPQDGFALTYYMLYINVEFVQQIVAGLSDGSSRAVCFSRSVVQDARLHTDLVRLCQLMFKIEHGDELEIESNVYEVLSQIVLKYGAYDCPSAPLGGNREQVQRGYAYLMDNVTRNVSLEELSSFSGLSPYHFLRAFRHHIGLPPHNYQLQQRISIARRMLAAGQPIAHVAADVGFADQSHFTRKFKAFVGTTPGQYQSAFLG